MISGDFIVLHAFRGVNKKLIKMNMKGGRAVTLRERRKKCGMTQEYVAKRLGVDQSAVSNWERGANALRLKHKKKLARLYKCTLDELFPKQ